MKNIYRVRLFLEESAGVILEYDRVVAKNAFRAYDMAIKKYKDADWDAYRIIKAEVYNKEKEKVVYAVRAA